MRPIRVVHYINQFFGGIGGEDKADVPVQVRDGPVGPGRPLQSALGADGTVIATIICGDNYFSENRDQAASAVGDALAALTPDVVVAGPAFDSGRHGLACAQVCTVAQARGIPAVTAMHPENAGLLTFRNQVVCIPTGQSVTEMSSAIAGLARLALKLGRGEPLGSAEEDGYLPRGIRRLVQREKTGADRAIDMVLARVLDQPFVTEIPVIAYDRVEPTPPIRDLASTRLAIVTSGGLVPHGNPDRLPSGFAEQFFRYAITELPTLEVGGWESIHGGYSTRAVNSRNPNFVVPLDVVRELERAGAFGQLYPYYFATVGNGTAVSDAKRMGAQIAEELVAEKVGAALFVAT